MIAGRKKGSKAGKLADPAGEDNWSRKSERWRNVRRAKHRQVCSSLRSLDDSARPRPLRKRRTPAHTRRSAAATRGEATAGGALLRGSGFDYFTDDFAGPVFGAGHYA